MRWFRFYDEVLDDPKVQALDGETFKRWVNLLCLANNQTPRGTLPDEPRFIAFRLRIRLDAARRLLGELKTRGLVDDYPAISGRIVLHNWEKRQQSSDDSAPRMARSRRRATLESRVKVTAAPPSRSRRLSSLDRDRDRDRDSEKRALPTGVASGASAPTAPAQGALPLSDLPGRTKPKPRQDAHPAVQVYRQATGISPREPIRALIADAIPLSASEDDLHRWTEVITTWLARSYSSKNVDGMLDWYREGIPPTRRALAASLNGRATGPPDGGRAPDAERLKAFEKYG